MGYVNNNFDNNYKGITMLLCDYEKSFYFWLNRNKMATLQGNFGLYRGTLQFDDVDVGILKDNISCASLVRSNHNIIPLNQVSSIPLEI